MKRFLLSAALALTAFAAHAQTTWEIGVGRAFSEAKNDGIWYQKRFPHELDLQTDAVTLGLRTQISPRVAIHNGLFRFGQNRSHALAVTHDDLYTPETPTGCPGECPALATFKGHGFNWGVRSLVEFHTTGRTQVGFLVGPIVYRTAWTETIPDWFPTEPTGDGGFVAGPVMPLHLKHARWHLSGAAGLRVSRGRVFSELMWYRNGASAHGSRVFPPIWQSQTALTVGVSF